MRVRGEARRRRRGKELWAVFNEPGIGEAVPDREVFAEVRREAFGETQARETVFVRPNERALRQVLGFEAGGERASGARAVLNAELLNAVVADERGNGVNQCRRETVAVRTFAPK